MSDQKMGAEPSAAIVTGAGKGIGRAVALALARRGLQIVVNARTKQDLESLVTEIGGSAGKCIPVVGDVSIEQTSVDLANAVRDHFGGCDLLINAAGIQPLVDEIEALSVTDWMSTIAVNLNAPFLTCRAILPLMKEKRAGRIINLASGLAVHVQPGQAAYSASKAGLIQFTAVLAAEAAPYNVTAVSAHPGIVDTAIVHQNLTDDRPGLARQMVERIRYLKSAGLLIKPEDSARFLVWLAEAEVENGSFIRIDNSDVKKRVAAFWASATT